MFPGLYKKKKVIYDDFSKIYLTNNIPNKSQMKEGKETIRNSFLYSFKDKIKKTTIYNKNPLSTLNNINNIENQEEVNVGTNKVFIS